MKITIETSSGIRTPKKAATPDAIVAFLEEACMFGSMAWFKVFVDGELYVEMES